MKKLMPLFALLFIFTSCELESESNIFLNPVGEWKLVKTIAEDADSERTGDDLEFQETYIINNDGTFTKTRILDETTTVSTGTYTLSSIGPAINQEPVAGYIHFTHSSQNDIIANCGETLVENMYFTMDFRLKGSWIFCDGLELEYVKMP